MQTKEKEIVEVKNERYFYRKSDKRPKYYAEQGSDLAPIYTLIASDKGVVEVEITGNKDIYKEIQSHRDMVDIKNIMLRYDMGDFAVMQKNVGQYMDVSTVPNNYPDIVKTVTYWQNQFEKLPIETREAYNFDLSQFVAGIGTEKWNNLMLPKEPPIENKSEEDKENE